IKRSRLNQLAFFGLCCMISVNNVYPIGAAPMGRPGCPDCAFSIASMDKVLMVLIDCCLILFDIISHFQCLCLFFFLCFTLSVVTSLHSGLITFLLVSLFLKEALIFFKYSS